ncbi:MAG: T9SS type A sorting domain-containing protein, partial [Ignavibacteria bacterium]|nr:T9SS type A sorting domain-containing protein [Ignavibacteria bacterium]
SFWPSQSQIFPLAQENVYPNLVLAHGPGVILSDPLDPHPPTDVTAYSDFTTPTSVPLTWTDPSAYASGDTLVNFAIEIHRDSAFAANVSSGSESYTDTALITGQLYSYQLFAKDFNDSLSLAAGATVYAGGAPKPNPPISLFVTRLDSNLVMHWINPSTNIDGTRMNDFAGINLYEDSTFVVAIARTPADTGRADSATYTSTVGTHTFYVTAFDNDSPSNESEPSNTAYSPITGVGDQLNVPEFFAVSPNYPNPFNPTTTIVYQLPSASNVQLVVYDILGQKIKTIVNERLERGRYTVTWDGRNDAGLPVSSGIYMFRFEAADFMKIHKMMLLK